MSPHRAIGVPPCGILIGQTKQIDDQTAWVFAMHPVNAGAYLHEVVSCQRPVQIARPMPRRMAQCALLLRRYGPGLERVIGKAAT